MAIKAAFSPRIGFASTRLTGRFAHRSGTVSPCLNAPIAMGYVETALGKNGTELTVDIRGKKIPTKVAKMPFVEPNYWRVPE